jgi:4-amino-4-deoxy-L-arabinose transferase-like glycosyltransferase
MFGRVKLKKEWNNWKWTLLGLATIILVGFALRIVNLTILPVFGDEAIYIRWSQIMGAEPGLRFVPLSDGKQPLFMWVLMFLVRRFSDPLLISRVTSVFYGLTTLLGVFVLSVILFKSKKTALVSSLFWAISPYSVFYDRLALVDSMLTMFGVWTLIFGILSVKMYRFDFAMLTGFALGGALLTKSPGIYFAIMLPVLWIVSNWPSRRKFVSVGKNELIHLIKLIPLTGTTLLIAIGMYNILRLGENFQMISIRNQDYVYPLSHVLTDPTNPFNAHVNDIFDWLWKLGPGVLIVFILLFLVAQIRRIGSWDIDEVRRPGAGVALLFIWSMLPIIVSAVYAKVFAARYILFSLPTLYIFAALIFRHKYKNKLLNKVMLFGLFVYILQALFTDFLIVTSPENANLPRVVRSGYLEEWTAGTGIKEISEILRSEVSKLPAGSQIVVGTEGYFGTLPDGLQIYLNDVPKIIIIGVGIDINKIPDSLVESKKAGNKTYLVVNASRLKANPDNLGLATIASYSKAFRLKGSTEYNLLGPRDALYLFEVSER